MFSGKHFDLCCNHHHFTSIVTNNRNVALIGELTPMNNQPSEDATNSLSISNARGLFYDNTNSGKKTFHANGNHPDVSMK